jgi:hypothetical protein
MRPIEAGRRAGVKAGSMKGTLRGVLVRAKDRVALRISTFELESTSHFELRISNFAFRTSHFALV